MTRTLRWIAPILVLGIAAALRFWALGRPGTLVFDELYYVRDAITQLAHGFPTAWPDDDPSLAGPRATAFTGDPSNAVHPPLGKWLIGLGILVFGSDSGWGWRSAVALSGVATVGITMRLGWRLSRSVTIACLAGLLLAIDGVHVVLTRVGLLDGFLTMVVALGALFVWRDVEQTSLRSEIRAPSGRNRRNRLTDAGSPTERTTGSPTERTTGSPTERTTGSPTERTPGYPAERAARTTGAGRIPILWRRPWLIAAGATFGAAAAIKWSGLYPLAFFLLFVTVRDLLSRLRVARERSRTRAWLAALGQAGVAALLALPAALAAYLASWAGWILSPGGWGRASGTPWPVSLARYHAEMWEWHSTLSAPHPYASRPLSWPLALKPTGMYEARWPGCGDECVSAISPLPNALVTWGGVAALAVLAWWVFRAARRSGSRLDPIVLAGSFAITGYLSGWLPWVLTFSRSAVFQFYAVVLTPFSALALALLLGALCGIPIRSRTGASAGLPLDPDPALLQGRRIAVAIFLIAAVALAILFFPVWSGMPIADWFWRAHLWLPWWA